MVQRQTVSNYPEMRENIEYKNCASKFFTRVSAISFTLLREARLAVFGCTEARNAVSIWKYCVISVDRLLSFFTCLVFVYGTFVQYLRENFRNATLQRTLLWHCSSSCSCASCLLSSQSVISSQYSGVNLFPRTSSLLFTLHALRHGFFEWLCTDNFDFVQWLLEFAVAFECTYCLQH